MHQFDFCVDAASDVPFVAQICRAIGADIAHGRLRAGQPLPGSRTLAAQLGVHRNTVVAAYEGLTSEGWLTTRRAGGTFVAPAAPEVGARPFGPEPRAGCGEALGFALPAAPAPRYGWQQQPPFSAAMMATAQPLSLAHGGPDLRLFPRRALATAYRQVLARHADAALALRHPEGHPRLRAAVVDMLASRRGIVASAAHVALTRGSLMALRLVAEVLLRPGDAVAVEDPGYPAAWEVLHQVGARLLPVPVDGAGLRVDVLAQLCAQGPVRAVYVTPHHQFPTTVAMAPERRVQLLELAAARRLAVLEDDYDFEFYYEGSPLRPLASADRAGVVVYLGSMAKLMAPGLRLGFALAPPPLIARLAQQRRLIDMQGDLLLELAIAELGDEGEIGRHVRRMRRVYQGRRDALLAALRRHLPDALEADSPAGGLALWGRLGAGVDADAWAHACGRRGALFYPRRRFDFHGRGGPQVRLCFGRLDPAEIEVAVRHMAAAHRACRQAAGEGRWPRP